jgi:hypothetical protein
MLKILNGYWNTQKKICVVKIKKFSPLCLLAFTKSHTSFNQGE